MPTRPVTVRPPDRLTAILLTLLLAAPNLLAAQGESAGGVEVTPDGGTSPPRNPNTAYSATFTVLNDGSFQYTFTLTCGRTGAVAACESDVDQITLGAGASGNVVVQYTTGSPGSGTVTLTASRVGASDQGSVNVTVMPEGNPGLALKNHNRDNLDRSLCLTTGGAGQAAAVNCGQLVVTHSTASYATMGRSRALSLVYNSGQAAPGAVVAATVTQRANIQSPSSLYLEIRISGVIQDSATWNTSGWGGTASPQPRQAVLWFVDTTRATGVYPFVFLARNKYPGNSIKDSVLYDTLIVVNRTQSQYGAGWSLAGVERLYENQPAGTDDILWVGGDGSARRYRKLDATHWQAAAGAFRDTLVLDSVYTRTLRHGIKVVYDSAYGRHIRTVNRTGQKSTFSYSGITDRLTTIQVPPAGVSGTTYTLYYDSNNKLFRISDPANRNLDVTVTANRLRVITHQDAGVTRFAYDSTGAYRALLKTRTTPRLFTSRFTYQGNRITLDSVPHDTLSSVFAVTGYAPWDTKGWNTKSGVQTAVDTALVFTKVTGPRVGVADDASFWVDRWGAPVRIVGAVNDTTRISRGNAAVPALVTKVTLPDGVFDTLTYDGRGNLLKDSTVFGGGVAPLRTRWYYPSNEASASRDSPDSIIDPAGLVSRFWYNQWGLDSLSRAPNGHATLFHYLTTGSLQGLVRAVTDSAVPVYAPVETFSEDTLALVARFGFNALGNVVADTSPSGRVRTFNRDAAQRVFLLMDPGGHADSMGYDALNRVTAHKTGAGTDTATTTYGWTYDVLTQVADPRGVTRAYRYDPAGRPIRETDDYSLHEVRTFDVGGNLTSRTLRSGHVVAWQYDAAGRMTQMGWPARVTLGTSIPADTVRYTRDIMGRLLQAWTLTTDTVIRTYDAAGRLLTDVTKGPRLVSLGFSYDSAGRRKVMRIGTAGSQANSDSVWYAYSASGDLTSIAVRWRNSTQRDTVKFWWDALGRRDSLHYTNGASVRFLYDADGRLRLLCSNGPETGAPGTGAFDFKHHVDAVDGDGQPVWVNKTAPLGCTIGAALPFVQDTIQYDSRHRMIKRERTGETLWWDRSGNRTRYLRTTAAQPDKEEVTPAGHNRLYQSGVLQGKVEYRQYAYDANGALSRDQTCAAQPCGYGGYYSRDYYYDGQGRPVGRREFVPNGYVTAFCFHDALGRQLTTCQGSQVQLAYDGENVVRTGSDNQSTGWTFIHGPGVDDPLMGRRGSGEPTHFFVTDGQGRQYVAGERDGDFADLDLPGARGSGGTEAATTFDASRLRSPDMPTIGYFRNRWYDQGSGRWTQEDPIGIAGGGNLYQYVGSNPVSFSDPFGLRPCSEIRTAIDKAAQRYKQEWHKAQRFRSRGKFNSGHAEELQNLHDNLESLTNEYDTPAEDRGSCLDDDDHDQWGGYGKAQWQLSRPVPAPQVPSRVPKPRDQFQATTCPGAVVTALAALGVALLLADDATGVGTVDDPVAAALVPFLICN